MILLPGKGFEEVACGDSMHYVVGGVTAIGQFI
jgi:hypothetical protein